MLYLLISNYRMDRYARVTGQLKSFTNKKHVGSHNIRPITDHNEVTYHLLEAVQVHIYFTRGLSPGSDNTANVTTNNSNNVMDYNMTGANAGGGQNSIFAGLTEPQRRVMKVLVDNDNPNDSAGVNIRALAGPIPKLDDILEELVSEGRIYTTIDDDHYKSTE